MWMYLSTQPSRSSRSHALAGDDLFGFDFFFGAGLWGVSCSSCVRSQASNTGISRKWATKAEYTKWETNFAEYSIYVHICVINIRMYIISLHNHIHILYATCMWIFTSIPSIAFISPKQGAPWHPQETPPELPINQLYTCSIRSSTRPDTNFERSPAVCISCRLFGEGVEEFSTNWKIAHIAVIAFKILFEDTMTVISRICLCVHDSTIYQKSRGF